MRYLVCLALTAMFVALPVGAYATDHSDHGSHGQAAEKNNPHAGGNPTDVDTATSGEPLAHSDHGSHGQAAEKNNPHAEKAPTGSGTVTSGESLPHSDHGSHGKLSEEGNPQNRHHSMNRLADRIVSRGELALAAGLSLQPMPVDFGNFYAGNLKTALVSTGLQLGMMGWGMVLVAENSNWNMHGNTPTFDSDWSRGEKNLLYSLAGGYVLSKLVSTWLAVDTLLGEQAAVALLPSDSGATMQLAWQLP